MKRSIRPFSSKKLRFFFSYRFDNEMDHNTSIPLIEKHLRGEGRETNEICVMISSFKTFESNRLLVIYAIR